MNLSGKLFQDGGDHRVTQKFGLRPEVYSQFGLKGHNGVDYRAKVGTPFYAVAAGKVIRVEHNPKGYGKHIRIENTEGLTLYAHLDKTFVKKGDSVLVGDKIGLTGNTGFSTGPHLHFEVRPKPYRFKNGYAGAVDPLKVVWNKGKPLWLTVILLVVEFLFKHYQKSSTKK